MPATLTPLPTRRELDHRYTNGFDVTAHRDVHLLDVAA